MTKEQKFYKALNEKRSLVFELSPTSAKASAGRDLFLSPSQTPYQQYVFMKDEKMLKALEIDYEREKVKVNLDKLYPNIDIAETLSNLTGKWIKKVKSEKLKVKSVVFEDGTEINIKDLDYKVIRPLIWWE